MILTMSDAAIQYFQGFLDCFTARIAVRNDVIRGYRCFCTVRVAVPYMVLYKIANAF